MIMSDAAARGRAGAAFAPPGWLQAKVRNAGFAPDRRFGGTGVPPAEASPAEQVEEDPVATAFAAGLAQGLADASHQAAQEMQYRQELGSTIARLDERSARAIAEKLRQTVLSLCESVIAEAALDVAALARRCERAVAALNEAPGTIVYLHPEDIAHLPQGFLPGRTVSPDTTLPRGQIRAENEGGGYTCGPDEWLRKIRHIAGMD